MMLTAAQRKRLAEEARKLAMECVEGTAPKFTPSSYCGCAIGEILARTGQRPETFPLPTNDAWRLAVKIDSLLADGPMTSVVRVGIVSEALIDGPDATGLSGRECVVFPLLALADALEAQP